MRNHVFPGDFSLSSNNEQKSADNQSDLNCIQNAIIDFNSIMNAV